MNVQKPVVLDKNKSLGPVRPTRKAQPEDGRFQQQMQHALISVDSLDKEVEHLLLDQSQDADLKAEVQQARTMYQRAMEAQQSLQQLYRKIRFHRDV